MGTHIFLKSMLWLHYIRDIQHNTAVSTLCIGFGSL